MEDASLVACTAQTILALYAGLTLWRGAVTPARKALARMLCLFAGYVGTLTIRYLPALHPWFVLVERVALVFGVCGMVELVGIGLWCASGGDPNRSTLRPRSLFGAIGACLIGLIAATDPRSEVTDGAYTGLVLLTLVLAVTAAAALGVGWRRGVRGSRSYFLACLWLFAPIVVNLVSLLGAPIPLSAFRLIRDMSALMFVLMLLTSYLDEGHEPMSLKGRLTSGALMAVLALAVVSAHLLLPIAPGAVAGAALLHLHVGVVRLWFALVVASALLVALAPVVFEKSFLEPLSRLTAGLARVETGGEVELPVDRRDELGRVARSFNEMVRALAEGRTAVQEKIGQLESRQREVEGLNDELRRQIAARSRQLADALKAVDRHVRPIEPGVVIDARYEVERLLGAGGMGMVFGVKIDDGRPLALKVVLGGSPDDAVRFMREAEIAATLDHPHLVSVIDVGMHHGTPYFVMERLSGGSLADQASRFGDAAFVLPILAQVATGLAALHAGGVLHRDLKPANVLLAGDPAKPTAKIGDFGIARGGLANAFAATVGVNASTVPAHATSATGSVMGTLPYMAPELAEGPAAFGPPSDVFAFGVLAWEVVTGELPFPMPVVLIAQQGETPTAPTFPHRGVDSDVAALIQRCVAMNPADRPSTDDLVRTLASIEVASKKES